MKPWYSRPAPRRVALGARLAALAGLTVRRPGPGSYRAYLDFQVDGQPRTAEFTLEVP